VTQHQNLETSGTSKVKKEHTGLWRAKRSKTSGSWLGSKIYTKSGKLHNGSPQEPHRQTNGNVGDAIPDVYCGVLEESGGRQTNCSL